MSIKHIFIAALLALSSLGAANTATFKVTGGGGGGGGSFYDSNRRQQYRIVVRICERGID